MWKQLGTATILGAAVVTVAALPEDPRAFRDCSECPEMVLIPAGRFTIGSPDSESGRSRHEGPRREVTIARFALGKYEVTRAEIESFLADTGIRLRGCRVLAGDRWESDPSKGWWDPGFAQGNRHPAVCVNWDDAQRYVDWLSARTGRRYRLPSEAEWEYAARAGTTSARFWGDDPADACAHANAVDRTASLRHPAIAQFHDCEDGYLFTAPVGSFRANPFGLHDMLGNVWEWVEDCWNPDYRGISEVGRARTTGECSRRVVRGGSWGLPPEGIRCAHRNWFDAPNRSNVLGFRVAREMADR